MSALKMIAIIAIIAAIGGIIGVAAAGPSGGSGTPGVVINDDGAGTWTIVAPDGSIIDWMRFDVARGELVQFLQGSASARVLNRVNLPLASFINGTITADGNVYIVNASGIVFGRGAVVDVGGLYAAAGDLSNEDFLNGVDRFTNVRGDLVNRGQIDAQDIALIGKHVTNSGRVTGAGGLLTLVAGEEVYLQRVGDRIIVRVDGVPITEQDEAPHGNVPTDASQQPGVTNTANGVIENDGGRIVLGAGDFYGFAVHNLGTIQTPGGGIELVAADGLIKNDGVIDVDNPNGDAGTVLVQAPDVIQAGDVSADAPNGAAGDITLEAYNAVRYQPFSTTTANGAAGTGSITSSAVNSVRYRADIETTGDIESSAREIVVFEDVTILSGGDQSHTGRLWLSADGRFEGRTILFDGEINGDPAGEGGLTVIGDATFTDTIGAFRPIQFLSVNGATTLGGGLVRTLDFQRYLGDVTLTLDTQIESLDGALVRFAGAVDGPYGLGVDTAGLTRFDGRVGGRAALTELLVTGGGRTQFAGDVSADVARLMDDVELSGDARFRIARRVTFDGTVTGNQNNLVITSPRVAFNGQVTGVDVLRTTGLTTIGADLVSARVVRFEDAVRLASHLDLDGTDLVEIGGALDGAYDLAVTTDGHATFGGNVGRRTQLLSLRVDAGAPDVLDMNLIRFGGSLVSVNGDILLNVNGRSAPAQVATISGTSPGSLLFESTTGRIVVGPNEKVTGLGDLTLRALAGSITVSDLNADGNLIVDSPLIQLRRRFAGQTFTSGFGLVNDDGPELVASGDILFSTAPILVGSGADPIVARGGGSISATLNGLEFVEYRALELDAVQFALANLTLDLTPSENFGVVDGLAEAFDDTVRPVRRGVLRTPFIERSLEELDLFVRSATFDERLAGTQGTSVFDDLPVALPNPGDPTSTTADRLWGVSVANVGQAYAEVFDPNDTGTFDDADAVAGRIRDSLFHAWDSYVRHVQPEDRSGADWRAFLEQRWQDPYALAYLDSLRPLFRDLRAMGLSPREQARVWAKLDAIRPANVDPAVLEEAAVGSPAVGSPAKVAMADG